MELELQLDKDATYKQFEILLRCLNEYIHKKFPGKLKLNIYPHPKGNGNIRIEIRDRPYLDSWGFTDYLYEGADCPEEIRCKIKKDIRSILDRRGIVKALFSFKFD